MLIGKSNKVHNAAPLAILSQDTVSKLSTDNHMITGNHVFPASKDGLNRQLAMVASANVMVSLGYGQYKKDRDAKRLFDSLNGGRNSR